jgi:hypothetical protein
MNDRSACHAARSENIPKVAAWSCGAFGPLRRIEMDGWRARLRSGPLMRKLAISAIACMLSHAPAVSAAQASNVIVGVNVVGIQQMSEPQQDALIAQLQRDHVKVVRTGIGEGFLRFTTRAYAVGIRVVAIVYPTQGGSGAHTRPADPTIGLQWSEAALTDADPAKFKAWLVAQLAPLENAGVHLAAFEVGNEINGPYFNGDFLPAQASGRVLGQWDLDNPDDPEGRAISASYRSYLRVLAALKDVRDHSKLNTATPVISAGLADGGLPGKKPGQRLDGVSIPATLAFMRRYGLDGLVDGYAVHVYPAGDPSRSVASLYDILDKDAFALCTAAKPCWLTEWGFNNKDDACPIDDRTRTQLIETMRGALAELVRQGRLAASIYFAWGGHPGDGGSTIFRCGALTDAGKLALSPM